jgi:hypothetical protein
MAIGILYLPASYAHSFVDHPIGKSAVQFNFISCNRKLFLMRSFVLIFLLACSFFRCHAHKEYFYFLQGTIGNRAVAMEIQQYDEVWFAKLFYKDLKKDFFLKGGCDSLKCTFSTYRWDSVSGRQFLQETFRLAEQPDHSWKGERTDQHNHAEAILLQPINRSSIPHLYGYQALVRGLDPYSFLRTADLRFIKSRTESFNRKYKIEWYREPISGIEFPRIAKGFTRAKRDSTNRALEGLHIREVENYFSCNAVGFEGKYVVKTTFTYVGADLISFIKDVSFGCQSARMSHDETNLTLSVKNGCVVTLEDIFWMGRGTPPSAESQPWHEYRYNIFGAKIRSILAELYPAQMGTPKSACSYNDPEAWQFPSWHLTNEGLFLGAFFPGINRSCDAPDWAIIPYDKLKEYTNPAFHF